MKTIYAKEVRQGSVVMYETSLKVEELIDEEYYRADKFNPITSDGYQRELSSSHVRQIAKYLATEGEPNILPTSLVLNSRSPLKIKQVGNGFVEIEVLKWPLFVLDGQHRLQAVRELIASGVEFEDYEIGVTLTNFDMKDEIVNFRNINTRANKVARSLNDLLMAKLAGNYGVLPETAEQSANIRATSLVVRLINDPESCWYGRIALGGGRKRSYHTSIQSAWADSILTMFTSGRFSDTNESPEVAYEIVKQWWEAIALTFPEAVSSPATFNIQRSLGFRSLNNLLSRVLSNVNFKPTKEQMLAALLDMREKAMIYDKFWSARITSSDSARGLSVDNSWGASAKSVADYLWQNIDRNLLKG